MIYTVTFNPSLDYIVSVENFTLGKTNRTHREQILPGGKGINVSIVLGNMGIENRALGFLAGFTGREIEKRAAEFGVRSEFIYLKEGNSRINLKLKDIEGTEINGMGPMISGDKLQELIEKTDRLQPGDGLVLAGSIPVSIPASVYSELMARLAGKGILCVVDATGELLQDALQYRPFLIKPNQYELGEIFQVSLVSREDVIPYAKKLQQMGAVNVLVSLAGQGAVLVDENGGVHESPAPKGTLVNAVGAGDSMVAGFLAGYLKKKEYHHAFLMGLAAGSASAFSENLATAKEIWDIYHRMESPFYAR